MKEEVLDTWIKQLCRHKYSVGNLKYQDDSEVNVITSICKIPVGRNAKTAVNWSLYVFKWSFKV